MITDNIKKIREEMGLSQSEFAKICHMGRTTYRNIESGEVKNITLEQICKICYASKTTPNDLIPQHYYQNYYRGKENEWRKTTNC